MAAGAAAVVGSRDAPAPGLSWLATGAAGQGVLAAVDVGILMAGAKRPRLAHLKSPARARLGLVTRSLKHPDHPVRHGTGQPPRRPSCRAIRRLRARVGEGSGFSA